MNEPKPVYKHSQRTTYRVENRRFNISRSFAADKTVSDLLTEELSSGLLQSAELSS